MSAKQMTRPTECVSFNVAHCALIHTMHSLSARALCDLVHYCCVHIKRLKLSWACYNYLATDHVNTLANKVLYI